MARGDWIQFLDADDLLAPRWTADSSISSFGAQGPALSRGPIRAQAARHHRKSLSPRVCGRWTVTESTSPPEQGVPVRRLIRNTFFLALAQIVGLPLTLLNNALQARYLGPTGLGYIYIAATFNAFGFMAVGWGHFGSLPALVATDRARVGELLGSALVWRGGSAVVVTALLLLMTKLLGYNSDVLWAVGLVCVFMTISYISDACQFAIFGFERTDVAARRQMVEQLLTVIIISTILILGGGLKAVLIGNVVTTLIVLAYVWRTLRPAGIGRLSFRPDATKLLLQRGTPFVFLILATTLQPYVDTLFLSKLAPDAVGWHAAARKLIGVLVFPAAVLGGAMYPTLCRLYATDREGFVQATSGALRSTCLLVFPVALGCYLFPEIGISVFSRDKFGPAEENLQILSGFLFLVYFSMPLGSCLLASGRQRTWALVQAVCVAISLVGDPVLVPWFDRHAGNGGLGVCWTTVFSELLMVGFGAFLCPRGIFDRRFVRALALGAVAGAAMVVTARVLGRLSPFVVAPIAVVVYAVTLWLTGGIEKQQIALVQEMIRSKLVRGSSRASAASN
jgi:O-antigen/teichoic acid export membrane protein